MWQKDARNRLSLPLLMSIVTDIRTLRLPARPALVQLVAADIGPYEGVEATRDAVDVGHLRRMLPVSGDAARFAP
ncbi:hypothetical protein AAGS40_26820 (plasmid) [Paraburkholderia sp. PREW-6R]|uniref:hypothetical protein n=1 Tax=Paraburkholderia sp. PREW-6R TaxID=3141544 RepID=UPI0031F48CDD